MNRKQIRRGRWSGFPFVLLLSIMMAVTFIPMLAFAELTPQSGENGQAVQAFNAQDGDEVGADGEQFFEFPQDEDLLRIDNRFVGKELNGFIRDESRPDGEDFTTEIKNVVSSDETVIQVGDFDGNGWNLSAEGLGVAKITLTYLDFRGLEKEYEYNLSVKDEVYDLNMWITDGSSRALPGSVHEVQATAGKRFLDEEGREQGTLEDLSIEWSVSDDQLATVEKTQSLSQDNPDCADVAFLSLQDQSSIDEHVQVKATLLDNKGDVVATDERDFWLIDDYYEVWPAGMNPAMWVGTSVTVHPELRHYALSISDPEKYELVTPVEFNWKDYNDEALSISGPDGNGDYTITRLKEWDMGLCLEAKSGQLREEQHYWFFWQNCRMGFYAPPEFDNEEDVVYNDGSFTYTLRTEGVPDDAEITYIVRRGNGNELPEGACIIDQENRTVTLDGAILSNNNIAFVKLRAEACVNENMICTSYDEENEDDWVVCRVAHTRIDYHFNDRDMLPGWDGHIDGYSSYYVEDSAHPFGEDINYEVTGVQVTSGAQYLEDDCLNEDKTHLKKEVNEENADDFWYDYRLKNMGDLEGVALGDVVFKVFYKLENDEEGSFDFTAHIGEDVYGVDVFSEGGSWRVLPGQSITMIAEGWHDSIENGRTEDGLGYKWSLEGDEDAAVIEPDAENPAIATVTFNPRPKDYRGYYSQDVEVLVELTDEGSEVASARKHLKTEEEFYQIDPQEIDGDIDIGQSLKVTPHLLHYSLDIGNKDNCEEVENVAFRWEDFNEEVLEISNQDKEGQYTITRKNGWDTDLKLIATWGDEFTDQQYHMNRKDYQIEFGFDDTDIYDDSFITLDPWIENGEGLDPDNCNIRYEYTIGRWNDDDWVDCNEDIYELDGRQLRIFGDELYDAGWDGLNVRVELYINDQYYSDRRCWVNLRESCLARGYKDHTWLKGILKQPTLDEVGYEVWICPDYMFLGGCGETRLREIPQLIDINDATVKVENQTYTGKALKPALTVTYGGKTLKAGTDFTATYTNNTKVGNATVTLKGVGTAKVTPEDQDYPDLFCGTKKAAFKIVKAANPMVVKTKAVTLKAKDVKKKNQTVKTASTFTVTKNQGKVTYKKKSGDAKITVAANGTITVKKGLKKGKYKLVTNVTAAGTANYNKITKAATVTITVK